MSAVWRAIREAVRTPRRSSVAVAALRETFLHPLLRAGDAMRRGGTVELSARQAGAWVVVTVSDEGDGVGPDDLDRIFDPLFAGRGAADAPAGLAGVARTMRAICGYVTVANRRRGGAVFTLTFPVAELAERAPVAPARGVPANRGASRADLRVVRPEPDGAPAPEDGSGAGAPRDPPDA